jgi:pyocin large subunit-like protein
MLVALPVTGMTENLGDSAGMLKTPEDDMVKPKSSRHPVVVAENPQNPLPAVSDAPRITNAHRNRRAADAQDAP